MVYDPLPFKISTGLKSIIGRDLITDDYVAVFELVKNAFDAHAKKVTITFQTNRIIIEDDGKGMDLDEITVDWNKFDEDPEEEFLNIHVRHRTLTPATKKQKEFKHGTRLEITELGSKWTREKKIG